MVMSLKHGHSMLWLCLFDGDDLRFVAEIYFSNQTEMYFRNGQGPDTSDSIPVWWECLRHVYLAVNAHLISSDQMSFYLRLPFIRNLVNSSVSNFVLFK
jgi:hypothetical protein